MTVRERFILAGMLAAVLAGAVTRAVRKGWSWQQSPGPQAQEASAVP